MSRSARRRKGRPYHPLPERRGSPWPARLLVAVVGIALVLGSLALFTGFQ